MYSEEDEEDFLGSDDDDDLPQAAFPPDLPAPPAALRAPPMTPADLRERARRASGGSSVPSVLGARL